MEIRTTARHFELTQELKDFVNKEINRLERYYDHIINSHLILEEEGYRKSAELNLKVYGTILTSQHSSNDFRTSIEAALTKMETQLKKYKSKLKERKFRERKKGDGLVNLPPSEEEREL
jgi:putative sigma-54 modulation protein